MTHYVILLIITENLNLKYNSFLHILNDITPSELSYQIALGTLPLHDAEVLAINSVSKEVLSVLSNHKEWSVRVQVAYNYNTPKETLEQLSKDEEWIVRRAVAVNLSTPEKILLVLTKDRSAHVQEIALETLRRIKNDC